MLEPKYKNITESVSDFHRMLDGMNKTSPLEYSTHEQVDRIYRDEQDMQRVEREIAHMENVLSGLGVYMDESDRKELGKQYEVVATRYGQAANQCKKQIEDARRRGMNSKFITSTTETFDRLVGKANEYKIKHEELLAKQGSIVSESRDVAFNSEYRSPSSALKQFRVLAGIEEQVMMPRDAGLLGTTRFNSSYEEMAAGPLKKSNRGLW